jgi:hypothetical protein
LTGNPQHAPRSDNYENLVSVLLASHKAKEETETNARKFNEERRQEAELEAAKAKKFNEERRQEAELEEAKAKKFNEERRREAELEEAAARKRAKSVS